MNIAKIVLASLLFFTCAHSASGQFWQGFLYGLGQAAQNYNNQQQYNRQQQYNQKEQYNRPTESQTSKTRKAESDGYVWYKLEQDGDYGIENTNGNVIPQITTIFLMMRMDKYLSFMMINIEVLFLKADIG